jgi:hypothetical protein
MTFDLLSKAESFHCEVRGQSQGTPFCFLAEFRAYETEAEVEAVMERINKIQEEGGSTKELADSVLAIAKDLLIRWVNHPEQPHLWMLSGGEPVECTPELLDALLGRTGVAFSVMMAYQKQRFEAKPGNSGSSRENGFPAPPQPRKTART